MARLDDVIIDARSMASNAEIAADLCIVGAGPAGISIALALADSHIRVALLERGGAPGHPRGGDGGAVATSSGDFAVPPRFFARFGGAANEWIVRLPWQQRGVRLLPLSPGDFEHRSWVPHSGWPIGWSDVERYYRLAHQRWGLGPFDYDPARWDAPSPLPFGLESHGFTASMEQFGRPSYFKRWARERLRRSANVAVYEHAPVGALQGGPDRVERAEIDSLARARLSVVARAYVVAGGGFENPRLLLSSRDGRGYGNERDVLGRYFMEHLRVGAGTWFPANPTAFDEARVFDIRRVAGQMVMGKIVPTEALQREHQLLHSGTMLLPRPIASAQQDQDGLREALRMSRARDRHGVARVAASAVRGAAYLATVGAELALRQRRFPPHVDAGWSGLSRKGSRFGSFWLEQQIEQAPNPQNRIQLTAGHDVFGRPLAALDWRWSDIDVQSLRATQRLLSTTLTAGARGRFEPPAESEAFEITTPAGAFHPMGGTRMHSNPDSGVVDADARVHGVQNLFAAGSSVFTTGGYANPTLTIVALALRLAERLHRELGGSVRV